MQIKEVMAKNVVTATHEESSAGAARKMREANIGCLVVVNSGAVKGIVTDRDLTMQCTSEGHDPQRCRISHSMTTPVFTVQPSTDILVAAQTMKEKQVKRLPVVDGNKLVGLVSLSDISQALADPMHDLMVGMGAVRRVPSAQ
jgi:CBS domain-containing protein